MKTILIAAAMLALAIPDASAQDGRPISELAAAYDKLCVQGGVPVSSATCEALKADIQKALGQSAGQPAPAAAAPDAPAAALPPRAASSSGTWFCGAYSQDYARYNASAAFDGGSLDRNAIVRRWIAHLSSLAGMGEPQSVFCLPASDMAAAEAGRRKAGQALTADGAEIVDTGWTPADEEGASTAAGPAPEGSEPSAATGAASGDEPPAAAAREPKPEDTAYKSPVHTADAQAAAGDRQGAIATLQAHVATVRADGAAHAALARHLRDAGDEEGALAAIGKSIDADPRNPDARNFRIGILLKRRAYAEALYDLDTLIADGDASTVTYLNRGVANQGLGAPAEAVADYDHAIAADPANALAYINKAGAMVVLRQERQAIEVVTQGLARDPRSTDGYMIRGMAWLNLFDGVSAAQDFSKVLELRPERNAALRYRAQAYKAAKMLPEALRDYDRLVELAPQDTEFLVQRGLCHQEQGNLQAALADYDRALAIKPGDTSITSRRNIAQTELAKRGGGGAN